MTREEIMELGLEDLETRAAEIAGEIETADKEQLETLSAELDVISERKKALELEVETRRKAAEAVANGAGVKIDRKEDNTMSEKEIRNSREYIEAYAKYTKTGKADECRALLSDNVVGGVVPVPDFVAGIVAEAVKASPILSRVRRMNARGNVKVGFEYSAPAAVAHTEGGDPVAEEEIGLGIVNLVARTWKKWVSISDEALDSMSGEEYLRYIYDEVTRGVIKARENAVVAAILAAPSTADATHPSVKDSGATTPGLSDFIDGFALLSDAATDPVIICTKQQWATYKGLAIANGFEFDPFMALEVIYNDAATVPIIGDLQGVMENCPKGETVEFKYDDISKKKEDLVEILGRMPSAIEVVGDKFFARIAEIESES